MERLQKNPAANGAFGYGDRLVQVRYLGVRDRLDEGAQTVGARQQSGPRISRGPGQPGASLSTVTERAPSLTPASSAGSWGLPLHAEIVQTTSTLSTLTLASSSLQAAASTMGDLVFMSQGSSSQVEADT